MRFYKDPATGYTRMSYLADDNNHITHLLCCVCFEWIAVEDVFVDAEGQKWDTCKDCAPKTKIGGAQGSLSVHNTTQDAHKNTEATHDADHTE